MREMRVVLGGVRGVAAEGVGEGGFGEVFCCSRISVSVRRSRMVLIL